MKRNILIFGNNFSGRSEKLKRILNELNSFDRSFYVGPYSESALSGFATNVLEEILIYHGLTSDYIQDDILPGYLLDRKLQKLSSLSGGEQVLLSLYCFAGSKFNTIGIDTALEQLDKKNRDRATDFLRTISNKYERNCILIDNRINYNSANYLQNAQIIKMPESDIYKLYITDLIKIIPKYLSPTIEIRKLNFSYTKSVEIFNNVNITLVGGQGYRLRGDNGTGKSTFIKLLTGVLPLTDGSLHIDNSIYMPYIGGNSLIAFSMQNPDDQWAGISIQKDIKLKLKAMKVNKKRKVLIDYDINDMIKYFGIPRSPEYHLLDLPKALRKRLSWLWPIGGLMPWIALDEPTIGQDQNAIKQLAIVLNNLTTKGYGVLFITHNEEFAKIIDHKEIIFKDKKIIL